MAFRRDEKQGMDSPLLVNEELLFESIGEGRVHLRHQRRNQLGRGLSHQDVVCIENSVSSSLLWVNRRKRRNKATRTERTRVVHHYLPTASTMTTTLAVFFVVTLFSTQPAAATSYYFNHSATFFRPQQESEDEQAEEWYMVLIYSLLFGFFTSFFGAVVGYFSLLEDELFKRYRREGEVVYAQVVSYEFTRRGADVKCCDVHALTSMASQKEANNEQHRSNFEYVVVVEYQRVGSDPYKTRIRKRVKAQEGDFIDKEQLQEDGYAEYIAMSPVVGRSTSGSQIRSLPSHKPLPRHPKQEEEEEPAPTPLQQPILSNSSRQLLQATPGPITFTSSQEGLDWITPKRSSSSVAAAVVDVSMMDSSSRQRNCSQSNAKIENMEDLSMVRRPHFEWLELYVLSDYPKSGLPRRFVDRACSLRYRLSTLGLMVFDLALVAFCIKLAANAVLDLPDHHQRMIGWYAMFSFLLLLGLEIPLIHWLLRSWLESALREEYLEHADFAPWTQVDEDSSISSAESDAYLFLTRSS